MASDNLTQRSPRLLDPGYLAWLRKQTCGCGCGKVENIDAAHLRAGSVKYDKPQTGMQQKPDDRWALPLHHGCHMRQHSWGDEIGWWQAQDVKDPFRYAQIHYRAYRAENPKAPSPYTRKLRSIKVRKPRETRTKIKSRGFAKGRSSFTKRNPFPKDYST